MTARRFPIFALFMAAAMVVGILSPTGAGAAPVKKGDACFPAGCATDAQIGGGGGATLQASSGWSVSCSGTNEHAHYSAGAGGAIFKTRVSCTGYGVGAVYVNLNGLLQLAPTAVPACNTSGLSWGTRASSSQGQWVTVNGGQATYYTPVAGNGGTGSGWWSMSSTFWFTHAGVTSNVGSHHTYVCKTI
jgi:hypothetical protein